MKFFERLFRNKEKKAVLNFITILVIGVLMIIMSNTIFKTGKETIKKSEQNVSEVKLVNDESGDFDYKLEKKLEEALSNVEGVGKVKVMITLKSGREIVVAEDTSIDKSESNEGGSEGRKTTAVKEENKKILLESNQPLILKEIQPKIEGVIVIAQGGGNAEVKNSIIKAVQALLNVEAHKIEVLKMK